MIDFHSHILPNIDDGSTDMTETIKLIKEAESVGFTSIISTSHYIQGYYEWNEFDRKQLLKQVEEEKQKEIDTDFSKELQMGQHQNFPKLYLGSEIFIVAEIIELIQSKKVSTINNTKYILIELPMNAKLLFAKEILYKLIENGYKPIIAHPERYCYVQEDITYVEELAKMGILFQANYGSIIGMYGTKAQKTVKQLFKKELISFLGSDAHRENQIYPKIPKILKKAKKDNIRTEIGRAYNIKCTKSFE